MQVSSPDRDCPGATGHVIIFETEERLRTLLEAFEEVGCASRVALARVQSRNDDES